MRVGSLRVPPVDIVNKPKDPNRRRLGLPAYTPYELAHGIHKRREQ